MTDFFAIDDDDDDDEDDEVAQNKLLILVAKVVETGTYAETCLREKGVSGYATSQMVCVLVALTWLSPSDIGEPSIVALKTATLLAAPFIELVLRQSPVGENATNGVAEPANG